MINIAGFFVYLYGVDELSLQQAKDTTVLFHVHGRTRTYKDAEDFAHQLLFEIRKRGEAHRGLVVAALDNRNHGLRAVPPPPQPFSLPSILSKYIVNSKWLDRYGRDVRKGGSSCQNPVIDSVNTVRTGRMETQSMRTSSHPTPQ